ncbi:discoidin domain-containing protein [Bacteroides sp. OttesenSCG-928-J23]|nr:discoidin domain-containing protein [Bacteroides sp. OttesenSCG-928-J23]
MKKRTLNLAYARAILCALILSFNCLPAAAWGEPERKIVAAKQINPTTVDILLSDNWRMTIDFYGENIFRVFQDNSGGIIRHPEAKPEAQILVDNPRKELSKLEISQDSKTVTLATAAIAIELSKETSLMKVINLKTRAVAFEEVAPLRFEKDKVTITLKENADEYFYGGGVQNGRFAHKGKAIAIENQNSWTDGGVASPTPYYWSTNGYAAMWYTFKKGRYDFGATEKGMVRLYHECDYLDIFYMVSDGAVPLLNDFYQLTGHPVLMPKFGFYQGHLNAYNRDYWVEDEKGILFEDGKRYKESQKDNGGIKESLNGEKDNYQFSARAVIDRYKKHDMPLGWLLPNDGYGAGYGQTETLDGNIRNLKDLTDYAHSQGVEIGLWTQSDLHPKPEINALLQRDIVKEVRDAGVRVLKTDVAWVGAGYSFGLNGVADVAKIMPYYGDDARPFIISLDGWAGTQRYAGIWSGDQTGGNWEYIRFHIPTYIGSGLSGQPNICSDMDGIFGGKNPVVNTRDFQWKTFTPMELNMDGWGSNEKYPHALGEPATSINRWYLKLKSKLMPYTYSIAKEAIDGMPMIRAMFLEYPNPYTLGKATQYQFMYGPSFLVAPIWQATQADDEGNDVRNGIYLPQGTWIDYFTGQTYEGECILNSFASPLWKLPVFVKNGAIIPLTNPNNNVSEIDNSCRIYELYPFGQSSFAEYDDDGSTQEYLRGRGTTTLIESNVDNKNKLTVTIHPASGHFAGLVKEKSTEFRINLTQQPGKVSAQIGKNKLKLRRVDSMDEFRRNSNVYFYDAQPNLNRFATAGSEFEKEVIIKNPLLMVKLESADVTVNRTELTVEGFRFATADAHRVSTGPLSAPQVEITEENIGAYTLKPTWNAVPNADFYEINFNNMLYTTIKDTELLFDLLEPETAYNFKIRSANKDGYSDWAGFDAVTQSNPLEFAIQAITGWTSVPNQGGSGIDKLFDFEESKLWHTRWGNPNATPFDLVMDLHTINQLDKFHYLPRQGAGNGTLLKGSIYYSNDKETWTEAGNFHWPKNDEAKVFEFTTQPTARYIKLAITETVGGFGSGRELYVFKVPGTEGYIPGDINNDGRIDSNDLTSYTNYTGLRKGDADFEGYISNGDINKNNLIDAYDISVVATQLDGGISKEKVEKVEGSISISTARQHYNKDEIIEVRVRATDLRSVNAWSFALPYNPQHYEFVGVQPLNIKEMENLTNDRLHTNGVKALYPTFVNLGEKETLEGTMDLCILKFKARQRVKFDLQVLDEILADKMLNTKQKTTHLNTH